MPPTNPNPSGKTVVLNALRALQHIGLVTDRDQLNTAYYQLTQPAEETPDE